MNRRKSKRFKKRPIIKEKIYLHIEKNIKEYAIFTIIFVIGIIIGIFFINNTSENQKSEITSYINSFVNNIKQETNIDEMQLLKNSIKNNFIITLLLWFMGSTVIGISIVYIIICFRGFCLGYTISSIIAVLRYRKRINIFTFKFVVTKFIIYTMHNFISCKWYETI